MKNINILPKEEYKSYPSLIIDVSKWNLPEPKHKKTCTVFNFTEKESKQETLEEAIDRNFKEAGQNAYFANGFKRGAKWKEERSYSEEEVLKILLLSARKPFPSSSSVVDWFEQFSKLKNG